MCAFLVAFCLALVSQGCGGPDSLDRQDGTQSVSKSLPFHSDTLPAASSDGARPAVPSDPKLTSAVPFQVGAHSRILPSGTLLTVQLARSLSVAKVRPGDLFAASVAAPIMINGETLIDQGAAATGRVESAHSETDTAPALGYFQLTLDAITIAGRPVALQTASLFARATIPPSKIASRPSGVRVQKGRRLTFRLMAPVTLDDPRQTANRGDSGATVE